MPTDDTTPTLEPRPDRSPDRPDEQQGRPRAGGSLAAALVALVLLGAMVGGVVMQRGQEQGARTDAERAEARVALAREVRARSVALTAPARAIDLDAEQLRRTLEDMLVVSDRDDDELAADRATLLAALTRDAEVLRDLVTAPAPDVPALLDRDRVAPVVRGMTDATAEAAALADEVETAVREARTWAGAVDLLAGRAAAYVASVSELPAAADPEELATLWEAERAPLEALATAATEAAEVAGLEQLAGAYGAYAAANLAWIDEAVSLLEGDDAETYNERLDELFGVPDPFGFNLAVANATSAALRAPALEGLTDLRRRTLQLRRDLAELDRAVATRLSES